MSTTEPALQSAIHLWGAKGGVGTSTVVAVIAVHASRHQGVELRAATPDALDELAAILGMTRAPDAPLTLPTRTACDTTLVVIDGGTDPTPPPGTTTSFLVIRPCYLAIRRGLASGGPRPAGVILVEEPERSLGRRDIEDVLGVPVVATFAVTPAVARLVDAGLLMTRPPRFPLDAVLAHTRT